MTEEQDSPTVEELNEALTRLKFAHGLCRNSIYTERIGELIQKTQDLITELTKESA